MNIRSMIVTFTDHADSQTLAWKVQGLVDLWVMGIYFAWFIYTKSMLGFMGIYGDLWGFISPAVFP